MLLFVWNKLSLRPNKPPARVPEGIRIYAVGDVHGCADLLDQAFARIDADLGSHPKSDVIEVFLGDYVDRGPNSREVIDLLISRGRDHRTVCLSGNHETYVTRFLKNPAVFDEWIEYGGLTTLKSYGLSAPMRPEPGERDELSLIFDWRLPTAHRRFFDNLKLSFTCGDFLFVHAGVRPGVPLPNQCVNDLLWIRQDFLFHEGDFGKVIVHGHTPVRAPDIRPNRINIDTGAYATGQLTCLLLQADETVPI